MEQETECSTLKQFKFYVNHPEFGPTAQEVLKALDNLVNYMNSVYILFIVTKDEKQYVGRAETLRKDDIILDVAPEDYEEGDIGTTEEISYKDIEYIEVVNFIDLDDEEDD